MIKNAFYLIDYFGNNVKSLDVKSREVEHVKDGINSMSIYVESDESVSVDEEIVHNNHRYVVTEVNHVKGQLLYEIVADSVISELNDRTIHDLKVEERLPQVVLEQILEGDSTWNIGEIAVTDKRFSGTFDNQTELYAIRTLARMTELHLDIDTINRVINLRNTSGKDLDYIFSYNNNVSGLSRKVEAPVCTVIYPYGKDGLDISSVNNNRKYVENYDWYIQNGISLEDARKHFRKVRVWEDERYIYAGNLKSEAEKRLEVLSRPLISYETETMLNVDDVNVGDFGYVVDDELDIRVKVEVVRVVITDERHPTIEFNYLLPDLTNDQEDTGADNERTGGVVLTKNEEDITVGQAPTQILKISSTMFREDNLEVVFTGVGNATVGGLAIVEFTLDGIPYPFKLQQIIQKGMNTLAFPFVWTNFPEGSKNIVVNMTISSGVFEFKLHDAQIYLKSDSLAAGHGDSKPDIDIIDKVKFTKAIDVDELVKLTLQNPIRINRTENVEYTQAIDVYEDVLVERTGEDFGNPTHKREEFAQVENYQDMVNVTTQEEADEFIDKVHASNKIFKLIKVNEDMIFIVVTEGTYIKVNEADRNVVSDGIMHTCNSENLNEFRGYRIEWQAEESIERLEYYIRGWSFND